MGQEVKTTLRFDGRILEGTALLEREEIVFRGTADITVPFAEIFKIEASSGWLDLQTSRGLLLFELGPKAAAWAERIKNPKAAAEKLGLDASKKVCVIGKIDVDLRADIDASGAKVAKSARGKDFDVVFVGAASKKELEKLEAARAMMKDDGALWVVFPAGKTGPDELRERDVIIAGRTLQLTDGKPSKIGDDLAAIRFVIPPAQRKKK